MTHEPNGRFTAERIVALLLRDAEQEEKNAGQFYVDTLSAAACRERAAILLQAAEMIKRIEFPRNQLSTPAESEHPFSAALGIDMPPQEIFDAAKKIERYFKERGYKRWKLDGIQSREDARARPNEEAQGAAKFVADCITQPNAGYQHRPVKPL